MSIYRLTFADNTYESSTPSFGDVTVKQLSWSLNRGRRLTLTGASLALLSSVTLSCNGTTVFTGKIVDRRVTRTDRAKAVEAVACDALDLTRPVVVPKQRYTDTTVAAVLADLLTRADAFYNARAVAALTAPIDSLWFENAALPDAVTETLSLGPYALWVDPDTQAWLVGRFDELTTHVVEVGDSVTLGGFDLHRNAQRCYSAVELIGQTQLELACAEATPAWDSAYESTWQLRHDVYPSADADTAEPAAWVYRRFSYAGVDDLVEDQPVELVQKIGETFVPVATLPVDRENQTITAVHPILAPPADGRVNITNALIPGKVQAGTVYIRYRRSTGQPATSARYPTSGHAGWAVQNAGITRTLVRYCSDPRTVTVDRARRLWQAVNDAAVEITVQLTGPMIEAVFVETSRVTFTGIRDSDFPIAEPLTVDACTYRFDRETTDLTLQRKATL